MPHEWLLDRKKYLSLSEVRILKRAMECRMNEAKGSPREGIAVRDWVLINLVLGSGVRVQEAASLKCGDVSLGENLSRLLVRKGKNGRPRTIYFNGDLRRVLSEFFAWKMTSGEPICPQAPLFCSPFGRLPSRCANPGPQARDSGPELRPLSKRSLQYAFKRGLKAAGLPLHYSIHALRHTFGTYLLKSSRYNLRLVQEQLGHARVETTQIYTHVLESDMVRAVENLYRQ